MTAPAAQKIAEWDAVQKALAAYLTARVGGTATPYEIRVVEGWPPAGELLSDVVVSVYAARTFDTVEEWLPALYDQADDATPGSHQTVALFTTGQWRLPVQVDIWCVHEADLSAVSVILRSAMKRDPAVTLGTPATAVTVDISPMLELTSTDLQNTSIGYFLEGAPVFTPSERSQEQQEFRATWAGWADGFFVAQQSMYRADDIELTIEDDYGADPPLPVPPPDP